ncbi:conserved hypothetical protein [Sphingomonas aurantiaca]|jgi:hypothetical protein|uniref:Uncharacterized protein n=1 Tax=Sphingomonas aurantiaca TaxID=185949 RepID=A0A5E7Z2Q8_9SPHN|nr:hypothetical protein [Sphingomonas aurantiaca]VVT11682.1 conserved hypothetical protein [Sphingomonas aurantiaca]
MNVNDTRKAIKALPHMTVTRNDGEWRVTVLFQSVAARNPAKSDRWCREKQEKLAYYTNDADDALGTARDMSKRWEAAK